MKAFVNTVRIKSADLKSKFLLYSFAAFRASLMKGNAADCDMLHRMIREIKVPRDRLRCVLVVFLYITKVFSESVALSSPCFADV